MTTIQKEVCLSSTEPTAGLSESEYSDTTKSRRAHNTTVWVFQQNFCFIGEGRFSTLDIRSEKITPMGPYSFQKTACVPIKDDLQNTIERFGGIDEKDFVLITEDNRGRPHARPPSGIGQLIIDEQGKRKYSLNGTPILTIIIKTELLETIKNKPPVPVLPISNFEEVFFAPRPTTHNSNVFMTKLEHLEAQN